MRNARDNADVIIAGIALHTTLQTSMLDSSYPAGTIPDTAAGVAAATFVALRSSFGGSVI